MIRISKLADYAVVILAELSKGYYGEQRALSAMAIASATNLPETTVAKVMKNLARENLLTATRGAAGGYVLARPIHQISVRDIVEAVDGPIGIVDCTIDDRTECQLHDSCGMKSNWRVVNDTIRSALGHVTLADMMAQIKTPEAA